jgi:hypothetical protein
MQQNELANLLDISPAMVSRLAKRGMPTDTLERAQRWRKRHLEPARVKGSRFDKNRKTKPAMPAPSTPNPAALLPGVTLAEVELAGVQLDQALSNGDRAAAQMMTSVIRVLLRSLPTGAWPAFTLRVWEELTAGVRAILPPDENNPLCDDGSPVYPSSMTDEEAHENGRFWFEVAAGLWVVNEGGQPTAP